MLVLALMCLGCLPENLQSEVIRRIATLQTVGPDALKNWNR